MAIYEFLCEECGNKFEELVWGTRTEHIKCPKCGVSRIKRLVSTFGYNGGSGFKSSSEGKGCSSCGGGSCRSCGHH